MRRSTDVQDSSAAVAVGGTNKQTDESDPQG
jgi:hypothetical protein